MRVVEGLTAAAGAVYLRRGVGQEGQAGPAGAVRGRPLVINGT